MSVFATTTRTLTMSVQVGRQARSAPDNYFESLVPSNIVQEPSSLWSYLRPSVFLRRRARESAGLPAVYDNRFGSDSCCTVYPSSQRSKMRKPSSQRLSWYEPLVLDKESVGVIYLFSVATRNLSYCTLGEFSSRTFFRVSSRRPVLRPEVCLLSGWTPASSATVLRVFVEGIISYTSYSRTNDCIYNGYVNNNLEHNTMINIDTVAHMNMHYTQY